MATAGRINPEQHRETSREGAETVVLVHGLWMTGLEMRYLGAGLEAGGMNVHYYRYPSLSLPPQQSAARLAGYVNDLQIERVHLVAHSLGGIVVLNLFHLYPDLPDGRVVLLGAPVRGSGVARIAAGNGLTRFLLGCQARSGLVDAAPPWRAGRQLGVIAGTHGVGVGRVLGGVEGANDGTVSVSETEVTGALDRCQLKVSHMGMLFSRSVVQQTLAFLRRGQFDAIR